MFFSLGEFISIESSKKSTEIGYKKYKFCRDDYLLVQIT